MSLMFADSLAVLIEDQSIRGSVSTSEIGNALQKESGVKPWISEYIHAYVDEYQISIKDILSSLKV